MKTRISYIFGAALACAILVFAPVVAFAESENANSVQSSESSTKENESSESSDAKETPEQELKRLYEAEGKKNTQAARVKDRVAKFKVRLTAQEQAKIKSKCVAAQTNVTKVEEKVDSGVTNRSKAYDELLSHLDKLITKLKEKSVDTTKLEGQRTELATKIETFKADLAKYKLALNDLRSLGCVNDPEGFRASLESARAARVQVASDAAGIRNYAKETIKQELVRIKQSLDSSGSDSSDNEPLPDSQGGAQ